MRRRDRRDGGFPAADRAASLGFDPIRKRTMPTMPEVTHAGGCHCGRVRYEVDAPARIAALDCNCSLCSKAGYLHLIVPASRFRLLAGDDALATYRFNTGVAQHRFCRVCGIKSFYVPRSNPDGIDVNVRCLDPATIASIEVTPFDGAHWEAAAPAVAALSRGLDVKAATEAVRGGLVEVHGFRTEWRHHFDRLNRAWLDRYFKVEPIDEMLLENPEREVLARGGAIFFATLDGRVVGTGALLTESPGVFELGKMAVEEGLRGRGIGRRIVEAAIAHYRAAGGTRLFLESHSSLEPALALYQAMGFERQAQLKPDSHYQRSDVYMIYRE